MSRVYEEYGGKSQSQQISNNLLPALLSLFCCFPLAIVALVFSIQVGSRTESGDIAGARKASERAKTWSYTSIGLGLVWYLIAIIVGIFHYAQSAQ